MNVAFDQPDAPAPTSSVPPLVLLLVPVLGLIASRAALEHLERPFGWIAAIWVACFGFLALFGRHVAIRLFAVNGVVAVLAVGMSELILAHLEKAADSNQHYEGGPPVRDEWLGLVARPSTEIHAWETAGDKLVFDARYTNDSLGLRLAPPVSSGRPKGAVLFFGCSFVYGEGLNDDATLPYQVGTVSQGSYRIVNFGGGGFGPHQMLSALEHGVVDRVVGRDSVRYAIYEAIPEHVLRAAGQVPFQRHAPRYRPTTDGSVYFAGHLDDDRPRGRLERLDRNLGKSALYRFLAYQVRRRGWFNDSALRLYLGVVARSRDMLAARYPDVHFEVLLWGDGTDFDQRIAEGLASRGIPVRRVPEILPHFEEYIRGSRYRLSPQDGHPDSVANAILARYVVSHILR
jgi:hypothetical protein